MAHSADHQKSKPYFNEVLSTTWTICKEYWVAVAIAWVIAPIADILIYFNLGRTTASEWTFSSIMTDKIPFTIFVFALTVALIVIYSPYVIWRKNQEKIRALEGRVNNRPALKIEYDPKTCLKITGSKYVFSVVVASSVDSIAGVIIGMEAFNGIDGFGHINRPFRFKHYDAGQLTCNLGEKVSVNILFLEKGEKQSAPYVGRLQLLFQGDAVPLPGEGPYTMTLRATGGRASPDYKSFRIGIRNEIPFMESISS
jgi:hypothetical protein